MAPANKAGLTKAAILRHEREILHSFFSTIGVQLHLTQRDSWIPGAESHPLYQAALETLRERRTRGWNDGDLKETLTEAIRQKLKTPHLYEVLPLLPPGTLGKNRLKPDERPTHPQLKIFRPPLLDQGVVIDPGQVIIKAHYSLEDLTDYYLKILIPCDVDEKRIENALRYFLDQGHSMDVLLHAIDVWKDQDNSLRRGDDPFKISEYIFEAARERERRLNR